MNREAWVSLNGGIDPNEYRSLLAKCPKCNAQFQVVWNEAHGFCEREPYNCPTCNYQCGTVVASDIPKETLI